MPTYKELKMFQNYPLDMKIRKTQLRIREWVGYYGSNGVYVSFSGGKDSTVLLHIVRQMYPNIEAVFVNTGLEYPEIQSFVKTFDNVTILRPKMRFDEVIRKYGYPMISKEVAQDVDEGRKGMQRTLSKFDPNSEYCKRYPNFCIERWKPLLNTDFKISHFCCSVMKKSPAKHFEKTTGKVPILAVMAEESRLRATEWLNRGCNAFEGKRIRSNPLSFWTEQDILAYIKENNLPIASVYGDVVYRASDGLIYNNTIMGCGKLCTTGCHRTGCIFCGFGAHREKKQSRFEKLKQTHPRQYEYCMGGGAYDTDGLWKPTKEGLGMAHCIDELNKIYGLDFIKY